MMKIGSKFDAWLVVFRFFAQFRFHVRTKLIYTLTHKFEIIYHSVGEMTLDISEQGVSESTEHYNSYKNDTSYFYFSFRTTVLMHVHKL